MSRLMLLCVLSLLTFSFKSYSQALGDFRTTGANTSWNNIASWERYNGGWLPATAGQIPGTVGNTGNVTILDGHTINHDVTFAVGIASLTVGQGASGTLNVGGFTFTVTGATTITANASVTVTSVTAVKTFTGDFTNNGTWNNSGNSAITFGGSITNNNAFTSGTGIYTLSGASKTINGTISFASLTVSNTYANNGTLSVVTTLGGASTLTNAATGVLNLSVATVTPTLAATAVGNTVNYIGAAQAVKATTYHHLVKNSAGTATAGGAIIVNGNLSVSAGILAMTTSALTVTGTTDIAFGASLTSTTTGVCTFTGDFTNNGTWSKTSANVNMAGNLTNNGTLFTSGSGVYTFSGTAKSITTTNASALTIQNATFTGSYTISSNFGSGNIFNVSTATNLSVATSAVTNDGFFSTPSLTLTNAASTFVNNGTVTVVNTFAGSLTAVFTNAANSTLNNGATTTNPFIAASAVPNTVNYNRTNTQTIRGGSVIYYNLNVLGGAFAKTLGAAIEVLNVLDISGTAIFADGGFLITAGGSVTTNVGANSGYTTTRTATPWFTPIINIDNTSTITYASTTATPFTNSIPSTYGNLVFSGSNTKTLPSSFPITVNGNLTISTTIVADNGNTITVLGSIASTGTQSGAGKVLLTSGAAPHGMQGTGWNNVELNDSQGATLTAAFTIGTQTTGTFALTNGVVSMNTFNFTISNVNSGGFTNGSLSATTMILQNGSGNFIRNIANSSLPITYLFPIGENTGVTEYSPVSITVTVSATISPMAFRVTDAQHPNDVNTTNFTSRYWSVVSAPTSFTYSASFGYTAADITGTESSFDVYLHDPTALTWELIPATSVSGTSTYDGTDGTFSAGNVFMVKAAVNIPATVTIDGVGGSAGVYATLTGTTGFFNAVNQGVMTANVTVNVTATPITETGAISLFEAYETGAGAGTYTITIQSNNSTQKVFTSTYGVATVGLQGTIRLNGADRIIFNGGTGTDRRLLFRNTDTGINGIVIHLFNDATFNQINNCAIEGSITNTTLGLIHIGTSTISGTGNDDNTITNNDIRPAGANTPGIGFSSNGFSASVLNDDNVISSNNFNNIYRTSSTVAAIYIGGNTGPTSIDANHIYNDTPRTGAITTNLYGIFVNGTSNQSIDITNNVIGYATSSATGITSIISTGAIRFNAISVLASASGTCSITGNIIDNITITSTSGGSSTFPLFAGVYTQTSGYLIDNNQIGGLSGVPSVIITTNTATTLANAVCGISVNSTASTQTISNNKIGSMSFTLSSGTLAMNLNGIKVITGSVSITGNEIGNNTANSFVLNTPGTSVAVNYGIYTTSTSGTIGIQDNIIHNMSAYGTGTTSQAVGIFSGGNVQYNIINNQISFIRTTSTSVSTAGSAALIGINLGSGGTTVNTIAQNTIYALTDSSIVNAVVNGIVLVGGSVINIVGRNSIYNLRSGTGTASVVNGIHISTAQVTVHNNMIRLGYDAYGSAITNTSIITGILKDNGSTNNSYYYNSVYIGGTGVSTTASNTYAFRRNISGSNDNVRNNIFVNSRSNSTTGGKHYAVYLTNVSTLTEDYNILYVNGTGGILGFNGTADQATMMAWRANTPYDDNSPNANPQFLNATSVTPDLNLNTAVLTPAESGAIAIAGLTDDRSSAGVRTGYPLPSQVNGGGTAPDIGADESDLQAQDVLGPIITVGAIAPINASCGSTQTVTITATITDAASGVAQGSLSPQLWWRLSSGTYASMSPTSVSGDVYTYDLVLTGIASLQTYHYYVAAQDSAASPNISYSHFNATSPIHTNVTATPSTINGAPGTFTILSTVPLSGSVNVGTGQVYTSLNANGTSGLFFALQTNGLSGNLTVNVTSNLVEDGLYYPLTSITEFCGTNYTVTIQPSTNAPRTITQAAGGNPLINLQGCTRVVFDGSSGGSGRYLTFASRQNMPTFYLNGNTTNITIKNCIIEGNNTLTNSVGPGVINFAGLLGSGTSINNILIDNNIIRNRSDLAQNATNCPTVLINAGSVLGFFNGTNTPVKEDITISNNEMHSFRQSAIAISQNLSGNGIGDNITISGNKIYSPITQAQYQYVIYLEGGGNSIGHTISNNQIGGSALPSPDITGTWGNILSDGEVWAIYVNSGGVTPGEETIIHNNKISNFNVAGTGWSNFLGIRVEYGRTDVTNNLIGSLSASLTAPNIICAGNGDIGISDNSTIMGIWTQSTEEVLIDSNIVCGISATGGFSSMDCIAHGSNIMFNGLSYQTPGARATITNNNIMYNRCASQLQSLTVSPEPFMGIFCWTDAVDNLIANNKIYNCGSGTTLWNKNVRITGMFVGVNGSSTAQTGVVENNEISYLFNENPGDNTNSTSRNPIIYGMTIANGDWTVANNTIYLNNGTLGGSVITSTNTSLRALDDAMLYDIANCSARYYHNTVYVSGSNTTGAGTANSTYAFLRMPIDFGIPAITAGAPIELRNNIFINDRGGQGNHRALGNIANFNADAAINWSNTSSDYNLLSGPSLTNLALWGASTTYTLANYQTLSGNGDLNSDAVLSTTGSSDATHINPSELFVNLAALSQADLRIDTSPPSSPYPYFFVDGQGTPVATVPTDIDGTTRSATIPTLGAFEMNPCATPTITLGTISAVCYSASSQNVNLSYSATTNGPDEYTIDWNAAANTAGFADSILVVLPSSPIVITIPAGASAATYSGTLTVRNSTSTCVSGSYSISVTVNAAPTITLGSNPSVCFSANSQNANLSYSATTGSPNQYSISSWSGGTFSNVTNASLTTSPIVISVPAGTAAGTYTAQLTVRNSTTTCSSSSSSISVTVEDAPAITVYSPGPTSASFTNNICAGSNTAFGITATGAGLTYVWQVSTNSGASWTTSGLSTTPYSGSTTATLSISNVPAGLNGNLYRVIVNGNCSPPDTSAAGTLNVGAVSIGTNPPSSTTVCENANTTITVGATGNNLTYQWQISTNGGGSWSALSNDATYSGVAGATLSITNAQTAMNNYQYHVIVGTTSCSAQTSSASILTVNPLPVASGTITGTANVCQNQNGVSYSVGSITNATGYNWSLPSGASIATGANTAGITVNFSGSAVSGNMTVNGTNACGNGTASANFAVTVNPAAVPSVSIAATPGFVICSGVNVTFTATPVNGGSTPSYQWKLNGSNVGSNLATYSNSTLVNGDFVTCEMTSNAPCASPTFVTSNTITMTVLSNSTPAVNINAPAGSIVCDGTSVTFNATTQFGGSSPSFQWKLNGGNVGTDSNSYTNISLNDGDQISVELTSNETCVTSNTATSNVITMTVLNNVTPSVSISTSPSTTECEGNTIDFTALPVNGGGTPSYQWKVNGSNVGTNSDTYSSFILQNGDQVTVVMTSVAACLSTPTATSSAVTVTIIAAPDVDAGVSMSTCGIDPYLVDNGASVLNTSSYSWSENGAGTITSGANTLTPTYTPVMADLGTNVTLTLTGNGNGNCDVVLDQVILTLYNYTSYFADADGDGFGDPTSSPVLSCLPVTGRVADNTDCCDTNADINPSTEWWADEDGDGFGSYVFETGCISGCSIPAQLYPYYPPVHGGVHYVVDCNDDYASAYPGSIELCGNLVDDDCDGSTDEGCSGIPNDVWTNAQTLNTTSSNTQYPNCYLTNGTVVNADISAQGNPANVAAGAGRDVWYRFMAVSTGVQIKVQPSGFNAVVELQNSSAVQLDVENVNSALGGSEILNYGNLTVGQIYWIGVRNHDNNAGGVFTICASSLMPSGCATVVPTGGLSLCSNYKALYKAATSYTFNFTGTGGSAPLVTTTGSSAGLIALTTPSLGVRYGGIYNVRVDANYILQNGLGALEPAITVLGSISTTNCTNVSMIQHPFVEVKSTQRCPAVLTRNSYLIGTAVPGAESVCGAVSYTYEFIAYSSCNGTSTGLPFTATTTTNTPYMSLLQAFPTPTYPLANTGYWRVRIRPNFSYGSGNYGPPQMIAVNGTSASFGMQPENDELIDADRSLTNEIQASIYPNPNNGERMNLYLSNLSSEFVQVRVMDGVGRMIEQRQFVVDGTLNTTLEFNQKLGAGLYLIEFASGDEIITERFVVE